MEEAHNAFLGWRHIYSHEPVEGLRTPAPSIRLGEERHGGGTVPRNKGTPQKGDAYSAGVPRGGAYPAWGILGHQSTEDNYTPERVGVRSGGGVGVGVDVGGGAQEEEEVPE